MSLLQAAAIIIPACAAIRLLVWRDAGRKLGGTVMSAPATKPPFSLTGTVSALDLQSIASRLERKGGKK